MTATTFLSRSLSASDSSSRRNSSEARSRSRRSASTDAASLALVAASSSSASATRLRGASLEEVLEKWGGSWPLQMADRRLNRRRWDRWNLKLEKVAAVGAENN